MQKFLATISRILHKWGNFFGKLSGEKQPWRQKAASPPLSDLGDGAKEFDGGGNAQVQQGRCKMPQKEKWVYGEISILNEKEKASLLLKYCNPESLQEIQKSQRKATTLMLEHFPFLSSQQTIELKKD